MRALTWHGNEEIRLSRVAEPAAAPPYAGEATCGARVRRPENARHDRHAHQHGLHEGWLIRPFFPAVVGRRGPWSVTVTVTVTVTVGAHDHGHQAYTPRRSAPCDRRPAAVIRPFAAAGRRSRGVRAPGTGGSRSPRSPGCRAPSPQRHAPRQLRLSHSAPRARSGPAPPSAGRGTSPAVRPKSRAPRGVVRMDRFAIHPHQQSARISRNPVVHRFPTFVPTTETDGQTHTETVREPRP